MNQQNGFSQVLVTTVIVGVLIVGGVIWALTANQPESTDGMMEQNEEAMMEDKSGEMVPDESMMEADDKMDDSGAMTDKPGAYKDYSADVVAAEQAAGNKVVLFFHAPWCPFCKAANTEFLARASEIPSGVTLLKTDYDSNTELKQKYGVTYQHTFVQIDNDGNSVSKWNGGDIDNLKKYLK